MSLSRAAARENVRLFDLEENRQNRMGHLEGMFHFSINQEAIGTADKNEGAKAFAEKRRPEFKNC